MKLKSHTILQITAATLLASSSAYAQTGGLGDIATNLRTDTAGPIADLLGSLSFIFGLLAAIASLYVFWNNHKNPHDPGSKPARGIVLAAVAAAFIGIPAYLGMGVTTFFGSGAETTSIDGSLRSIK